jgi:hypothetical protein
MYLNLRDNLSLDDALALDEIDEVAQSWRAAAHRNAEDSWKRSKSS